MLEKLIGVIIQAFPVMTFVGLISLFIIHTSNKAKERAKLEKLKQIERDRIRKQKLEEIHKFKEQVDKYGLEEIEVENLILSPGEICFYSGSIKLMKVLKTKHEVHSGTLYLTNQQFIFNSPSSKVSRNIQDISYIDTSKFADGKLSIQIGKTWYELKVPEVGIFEIILREAIQQYKDNNPKYSRRLVCEYCKTENIIDSKSKEIKCSTCGAPIQRKIIT